ncbi:MAG: 3-oxoadipyl-CoA thiolase [Ignavibacterium sp.]|nr:3-oxoadipyl-CoA thiolase [Ignavibacterium sp.]MDW8375186.1 3-oxoadipyl-CoA thiolase [Ignavibacteriales bacterium]
MREAFICDAIRTPIGRYGGSLSSVRPDDLLAHVIKSLVERNSNVDWKRLDDVIIGCANQSGEDNRNVARMSLLLAGLSETITGVTVNRLCGSGMEAVGIASRAIKSDEADLIIAGGVESMSRAPFVIDKASEPFSRNIKMYDTTLGWRFINPKLDQMYGTDSMMQTAENLATEFNISREDQDKFALWSQEKALAAQENGNLTEEIVPVKIDLGKGQQTVIDKDEHPRKTSLEKLAALKPLTNPNGTITAGNSSGINDGAAVLLIASEKAVKEFNLTPKARIIGIQTAGVPPRIMGIGPVPATKKLLARLNLTLDEIDLIELNEAFAAQVLACTRQLGLKDDDERINPQGGAIALGHPLGMSGARLVTTAFYQLQRTNKQKALCTMCIGVGQGIAMLIERV